MKPLLISLLAIIALVGCEQQTKDLHSGKGAYEIMSIEDCQYIVLENPNFQGSNRSYTITHKGNCSNPTHQNSKP